MKAWILPDFTGIGSLRLVDHPDPVPGRGEVVLDVHYAALNPADRYLAQAQYPARPALPHILGRDAAGTISLVGPDVAEPEVGDVRVLLRSEVGVNRPGTFAERAAVPIASLVSVPDGWTIEQAAGAPLVYLTAYQALTQWDDMPPAGVVLVTGASGGVGVAGVQLGVAMGHTVVALSRSAEKQAVLRDLGAAEALDPQDPGWSDELKRRLAPRRVDLAIDNIGGMLLPQVIDTLADRGRVSLVGRLAGPVPEFNTASLFFRRLRLGGVAVGAYTPQESQRAWAEIVRLLSTTGARPLVDSVFDFPDLPRAFERLERGPMGKVLVRVAPAPRPRSASA